MKWSLLSGLVLYVMAVVSKVASSLTKIPGRRVCRVRTSSWGLPAKVTLCPASHPFSFADQTSCCKHGLRSSVKCSGISGDGGPKLKASDPQDCCEDSVKCPITGVKCTKNPDAESLDLRKGVLLFGSEGTHHYPLYEGVKTLSNLSPWPLGPKGFTMPARPTEYPPGSVVVCGGADTTAAPAWFTTNQCFRIADTFLDRFRPLENVWGDFPPLLESLSDAALKVVGGTLWCFGGIQRNQTNFNNLLGRTQYFDELTLSWRFGHDLPYNLDKFGVEVISLSEVVVVGGSRGAVATDDIFVFNVITGTSNFKQSLSRPKMMLGTALVDLHDDQVGVLVLGGVASRTNYDKVYDDVESLNLDTDELVRQERFPGGARMILGEMISVNGNVYLFGSKGLNSLKDNTDNSYKQVWQYLGPDADPAWKLIRDDLQKLDRFSLTMAVAVNLET